MIKYKGTTIYPPAIYDALSQVSEIKDYLVEISKNEIETDEILIYIAQNGDVDVVERKIKNALQSKLRVIPALDFVSSQQLNAMRPSDTRKPTSIIFKAAHHE
jgi:phenylacetate-CoA ligase